jgi:hypothetical protein
MMGAFPFLMPFLKNNVNIHWILKQGVLKLPTIV